MKKFIKKYEVNYYDIDSNQKCKFTSIVNYLCDVGTSHSAAIGETIDVLLNEKKYTWVFYKYDIKMYKYPSYGDIVTIETEAIGFNKFYAYRKYTMLDDKGNVYGEGIALFLLINIERRRPIRVTKEQLELYDCLDCVKEIEMIEPSEIERIDYEKEFLVRYSDIDTNEHVNNEKYIEWAIESLPIEISKNHMIKDMNIKYEREAVYNDKIKVYAQVEKTEQGIVTIHKIISTVNEKELTRVEIKWE